jgi:hypothetical protein
VTKVRKRRSPLAKEKNPKINSKPFAEADSPQALPAVSNYANPCRFGIEKYPKNNSKPFAEADSPQACLRFRTLPILVGLAKGNKPTPPSSLHS